MNKSNSDRLTELFKDYLQKQIDNAVKEIEDEEEDSIQEIRILIRKGKDSQGLHVKFIGFDDSVEFTSAIGYLELAKAELLNIIFTGKQGKISFGEDE